MKKAATLILNRNLPLVTEKLYEHLILYDKNFTDIFVIEAGSDEDKLSKYSTWYVDSPKVKKDALIFLTKL